MPTTHVIQEKDEEFRNRLLTATMTESDFRKLVALNVGLYLKMLNLAPTVKRNADMVNSWILSGCTLWIRVAKGRDVPFVQLDAAASADFLSEFDRDSRGLYTQVCDVHAITPPSFHASCSHVGKHADELPTTLLLTLFDDPPAARCRRAR